ncbi:aldo/keto reductase [Umezawaea tangerina]|uniref:Aryl-alcohol dehydrogenase-like predicted oxidoreductase n=1 Tax=Umezawaea tangerina TaxID=84725 RepID=A0A2T0SGW1_9PSEU|nr:aldo/keto reductase [Umezawaea tangerina]PRY32637.1 aryl-alcohol dehydrogenase-like predicted oxidoreductase [Umezawaea tangerina]
MTKLGNSDLDVSRLTLGGNVFGWTADEEQSFAVLDAYTRAGGNFIDTADLYAGGKSETILGRWLAARGNRADVLIATKVGMTKGLDNLKPATIEAAAEASLKRLGVDHIDLYYAHRDDLDTPTEESLAAFDRLVRAGKVRQIAASNYSAERLANALAISDREGLAGFVALQPEYSLVARSAYEGDVADVVAANDLSALPYWGLAKGFLTGKYRPGVDVDSPRAAGATKFLDDRGLRVLAALDEISAARATSVAAVALAWLTAQPTVPSVLASARNTEQLDALLPVLDLTLSNAEVDRLTDASV